MKFLIIGLGNIGEEYAHTRHNIGFDVVDYFAQQYQTPFASNKLADTATIKFKGRQLLLIKPSTYMNLSGKAVKYWLDKEKIPLHQSLTIVDDLAIPLQKIRLKASGSNAGHNGLKSIEEVVATVQYPKLRMGIGNQFSKGKQVDFVLGKWNETEKPIIEKKIIACKQIIENFVTQGIERTMTHCNALLF